MAFDGATIKILGGYSHKNFQWIEKKNQKPNFQT